MMCLPLPLRIVGRGRIVARHHLGGVEMLKLLLLVPQLARKSDGRDLKVVTGGEALRHRLLA
jgi:hypothetical protein